MATSSGFKVFIVIILALVVWHYGAPYIGIPSWTTYLSEYTNEEVPADIYYNFAFNDITAGQEVELITLGSISLDFNIVELKAETDLPDSTLGYNVASDSDIPNYEIVIRTNAPSNLFPPQYKIYITGEETYYSIWQFDYETELHDYKTWTINTGTGEKVYRYQLDIDTCETSDGGALETQWTIFNMVIVDPNDLTVWHETMFIW